MDLAAANDSRNSRVIAALIAAMTLGAGILFLLEGTYRLRFTPLTAAAAAPLASVEIVYVAPPIRQTQDRFDVVVYPDGRVDGSAERASARLAVVGAGSARLSSDQEAAFLSVLRLLHQSRGLRAESIQLTLPPAGRGGLPGEGQHLREILVARGIIPSAP